MTAVLGYGICLLLLFWPTGFAQALPFRAWGTTTYEVYSQDAVLFRVVERFTLTAKSPHAWHLETALRDGLGPKERPEFFCPPSQEIGCDGVDLYYFKNLSSGTNVSILPFVEPGEVPLTHDSPSVVAIWLALLTGAGSVLDRTGEVPPPWGVTTDPRRFRQSMCACEVRRVVDPRTALFHVRLDFLNDGRLDLCQPRSATNLFSAPYSHGFTQAVYRTLSWAGSAAIVYPAVFEFEVSAPVFDGSDDPKTQPRSRIRGAVDRLENIALADSWDPLPVIPRGVKAVQDFRFTREVTNWDGIAYPVDGGWPSATDAAVRTAIKAFAAARRAPEATKSMPRLYVLRILLVIVVIGFPIFLWVKSKGRSTKNN